MKTIALTIIALGVGTSLSHAAVYDITNDWSEALNPNGAWSYNEGANALPHVTSWQSIIGGWNIPQPGWAESEDGNNRLPFWFQSNGSETFAHDFLAGDIVVHTTDSVNGAGNGFGNVRWTSPVVGSADISGAVWIGRDIGRANHWRLTVDGATISEGDVSSGDPYSRANPFDLAMGTGGANALDDIALNIGTVVSLQFENTTGSGDFVGVDLTLTVVPEPNTAALLLGGLASLAGARRKHLKGSSDRCRR